MTIRRSLTIDGAKVAAWHKYDKNPDEVLHVFSVAVEPNDLRRELGSPSPHRVEGPSILNVIGHPHDDLPDPDDDLLGYGPVSLNIDPDIAELVALGFEPFLLVCEAFDRTEEWVKAGLLPGDEQFIADLPASLAVLGKGFLLEVRDKHHGELSFNKKAGRYVEVPDGWFTIKPQPRAKSFAITIRARPNSFSGDDEFDVVKKSEKLFVVLPHLSGSPVELKPEAGGSSRFVLSSGEQIGTAMRILQWASKNKK